MTKRSVSRNRPDRPRASLGVTSESSGQGLVAHRYVCCVRLSHRTHCRARSAHMPGVDHSVHSGEHERLHQGQLHCGAVQRRRWSPAGGVVESSDLKCSASAGSVLHRNHLIHLWWPALAHSACQEGSAHVRKVSHTPSPAQESRPVHPTDRIRRLQHHGTSLSISTVSLVYPVSQTLRRLQSLMTQSAPTAAPGLQQSSPAYQRRSVVSAGRIRRVPQRESA